MASILSVDVPPEAAGFVDVPGFGPLMAGVFLVLVAMLAVCVGELVSSAILEPRPIGRPRPRRQRHHGGAGAA